MIQYAAQSSQGEGKIMKIQVETTRTLRRLVCGGTLAALLTAPAVLMARAVAQDATTAATGQLLPAPAPENAPPSNERIEQAANLIDEALTLAERNDAARPAVVRGAAALIPQLTGDRRDTLTRRWMRLVRASSVSSDLRQQAFSTFFDASGRDVEYGRALALSLPEAATRAGAFLSLSRQVGESNWSKANDLALLAQRAARQEENPFLRARALTFVALRLSSLNPALRADAVTEASSAVRQLPPGAARAELLAEVVGAAAKFDLGLARRIAADINDEQVRNTASARVNISEISQSTLTGSNADRIAKLAAAAAPYDVRAIPILLRLPPQQETLKTLSNALPPIYPSARPQLSTDLLEQMWAYAGAAEPSVYRDELQSRLARLMVLHDLWRGRAWGRQLAWKGGRVQVGAFLNDVIEARRSALATQPSEVESLDNLAAQNVNRAIAQARTLAPAARAEALLLIAARILG
jgi:hypothetical protein